MAYKNKPLLYASFLMGIFATMPIVTLKIGGFELSFFEILLLLTLALLVKNTNGRLSIKKRRLSGSFLLWLALSAISCFIGWAILDGQASSFSRVAGSYIPKIIIYIILFILWFASDSNSGVNEKLLYGIFIGAMINIVWSIVDASGYYIFGQSLNNIVFRSFAISHGIHYNQISIIKSGMIRASGFNYDPAHMGFLTPVGLVYGIKRRKPWVIVLSVLSIISSASTTSLICSIIAGFLSLDIKSKAKGITRKSIFIFVATVIAILIVFLLAGNRIISVIHVATNNFSSRISDTYFSGDTQNIRIRYIVNAPRALANLGMNSVLGLGFGTASYGYVIDESLLQIIGYNNNFAYDLENTYLDYLFDTGIVGFFLFFSVLFAIFRRLRKKVKETSTNYVITAYCLILSTVFCMFFYHYILYSIQMLGIICSIYMLEHHEGIDANET